MRPIDAVVLSREVIKEFLKKNNGELEPPIPVLGDSGLLQVISYRAKLPITVRCLQWPGNLCFGRISRYKDKAEILYSSALNSCWGRFVICKEAIHLLSGEEHYSTDLVSVVNGLINEIPPVIDSEIDAEWTAIYGAMELLIPKEMSSNLYQMEKDGSTQYEIAYRFRVPEKIISLRLSPDIRAMVDGVQKDLPDNIPPIPPPI